MARVAIPDLVLAGSKGVRLSEERKLEKAERQRNAARPECAALADVPAEFVGAGGLEPNFPCALWELRGQVHTKHLAPKAKWRAEKDKSAALRLLIPMLAHRVVPDDGRMRSQVNPGASLTEIAAWMGYGPRKAGSKYQGVSSVIRNLRRAAPLFEVTKKIGETNRFALRIPESKQPRWGAEHYHAPTVRELQRDEWWQRYFPEGSKARARYTRLVAWLYHKFCHAPPNARLVMEWLAGEGICRISNSGHVKGGWVRPHLIQIARETGMSVNCVREQLRYWKRQGILQLAPEPVRKTADGKGYTREPMKIIWLPGRLFDENQAALERGRLFLELQSRRMKDYLRSVIDRVHHAVVREWQGSERTHATLWQECWKRLREASVPDWAIAAVIPAHSPP